MPRLSTRKAIAALAIAAVTGLTVLATPAHAQFGGLVQKAKNKVAPPGNTNSNGTNPSSKADPITPDLVSKLITALKAENAERDKIEKAHAKDEVGALYHKRDMQAFCKDTLKAQDSIYMTNLITRMQKGDAAAVQEMSAGMAKRQQDSIHTYCNSVTQAPPASQGFDAMLAAAQSRQDTVGAAAGGFAVGQFAADRERVAAYVMYMFERDKMYGYTPAEKDAMNAHLDELKALLSRDFRYDGMPKGNSVT